MEIAEGCLRLLVSLIVTRTQVGQMDEEQVFFLPFQNFQCLMFQISSQTNFLIVLGYSGKSDSEIMDWKSIAYFACQVI